MKCKNIDQAIQDNPILRAVRDQYIELNQMHMVELLRKQTRKGVETYGKTVDPADYTYDEWLQMRWEEEVDAAVYHECAIARIKLDKGLTK